MWNASAKAFRAEVGVGFGVGADIDIYEAYAYEDVYVGVDDGKAVTGYKSSVGVSFNGIGVELSADQRIEENGVVSENSANLDRKPLETWWHEDTAYSISFSYFCVYGGVVIAPGEDMWFWPDFGIAFTPSGHLSYGGHAHASWSLSEYVVYLFE